MVCDLKAVGRGLQVERLVELVLGFVHFGEGGADAGAALAAAGGRVDERDLVDLGEQAHRELGAERQPVLVILAWRIWRSISATIISARVQ